MDSLTQAVKLQSPPESSVFFHIASCLERLKDFKKAVLNYKKCLTLDARHFEASLHLANLLANVGEGQRAAKYFKHALKVASDGGGANISRELVVNAEFGLGKTLQQYSDNKEAPIGHLKRAIELDERHFKA